MGFAHGPYMKRSSSEQYYQKVILKSFKLVERNVKDYGTIAIKLYLKEAHGH